MNKAGNALTVREANALAIQTPRILREFVREQYAQSNLKMLHETAMGVLKFPTPIAVPGMKDYPPHVEIIDVEAPAMVRVIAAKALVEVAIPKQMGLVDSDDKGTGVVILPALEQQGDTEEADFEVIEEEVGPESDAMLEDRDRAPAPREETVSPALVRHVLAQRGKNGKRPHPKKRARRHG